MLTPHAILDGTELTEYLINGSRIAKVASLFAKQCRCVSARGSSPPASAGSKPQRSRSRQHQQEVVDYRSQRSTVNLTSITAKPPVGKVKRSLKKE
jgi:hypothetical protein